MKIPLLIILFPILLLISCSGDNEPADPALFIPAPDPCSAPAFLNVSSFINGNTVRIEWDKTSGTAWEIQYGLGSFTIGSGTSVAFGVNSSLISGLASNGNYKFYIRTKCDDNNFSSWIGPVAVGSSAVACANPSNISAIRSTTDQTKVTVTWSANGDENSWQIQYGSTGFSLGTGTIVASSSTTKTLSNLTGNVSYDFYVRSNCSSNQNSTWVGPINIEAVPLSALMTANIAGVQYNNMKPYLYSFRGVDIYVLNPTPAVGQFTYI